MNIGIQEIVWQVVREVVVRKEQQNLVIVEILVLQVVEAAVVVDQIREIGGQGQNMGQVNILVFILMHVQTGTGKNRVNQSTESADFDKLDGWIVRRERSFKKFDIKQTWSACFFQILIGSNKNILMDKCTFHVSGDRARYQDRKVVKNLQYFLCY